MATAIRETIGTTIKTAIQAADGTGVYNNTIVAGQITVGRLNHWTNVSEFPQIYVLCGDESIEHLPGFVERATMSVSVVGYESSEDDAWGKIENLILDLKKAIVSNWNLTNIGSLFIDRTSVVGQYEDTGSIMVCNLSLRVIYHYHKDDPSAVVE